MKKILILFGHPAFKRSAINAALREAVETLEGITFHDLYASYPDFLIDVSHEQQLYRMNRQDEDKYFSMYQQHNANLEELMKKDREIDMEELDKAWTAANPEI